MRGEGNELFLVHLQTILMNNLKTYTEKVNNLSIILDRVCENSERSSVELLLLLSLHLLRSHLCLLSGHFDLICNTMYISYTCMYRMCFYSAWERPIKIKINQCLCFLSTGGGLLAFSERGGSLPLKLDGFLSLLLSLGQDLGVLSDGQLGFLGAPPGHISVVPPAGKDSWGDQTLDLGLAVTSWTVLLSVWPER